MKSLTVAEKLTVEKAKAKIASGRISELTDAENRALHRAQRYAEYKQNVNANISVQRQAAREIDRPHPPVDPARREASRNDLVAFCRAYFPSRFTLGFSDDHLALIRRCQDVVLKGGLHAVALPRGSGKTTICECACLWAILFGHRSYVLFIAATEKLAIDVSMASIRSELEHNELLEQDFSDAVSAIVALRGIARRSEGQTYQGGEQTNLMWTKNRVRLPSTAEGGGAILTVAGITGSIRGAKAALANGDQVRPDLVIIDDPQTDESARSQSQTEDRIRTITGTILGLAGPGVPLACVMPCTIINKGDLSDQFLDKKKHPEWLGYKSRMMTTMPKNMQIWDQYQTILADDLGADLGRKRADEFYQQHRAEMDEGASVSWEDRKEPDDVSAIQHAMNLRITRGVHAFQAEYQNDPMPDAHDDGRQMTAADVVKRLGWTGHRVVPDWAEIITAMVDVHQDILYFAVIAWAQDFRGTVIDYGTFPDQGMSYFTLREARAPLKSVFPGNTIEAQITSGLDALTGSIATHDYKKEDGSVIKVERIMVDANWGEQTQTVYQFVKTSKHASIILPSHGRYLGAASKPMDQWRKELGERCGQGWRISKNQRGLRMVTFDANHWKTLVASRFLAESGDDACLRLWGKSPGQHRLIADHLAAEYRVRTEGRGRAVDEWKLRPGRDNHWLDCVVGCAVGASIQGIKPLAGAAPAGDRKPALAARQGQLSAQPQGRAAMSLAEMRSQANARRGA
jgi:hypothetical protein